MIYLDTSVALAHLLSEDRRPPDSLWEQVLVSSRLLEYELWNRLHARGHGKSHGDQARELLQRLAVLEMVPAVLSRALGPFRAPVRTHDSLHLASIEFLRSQQQQVELATYDIQMSKAARSLGIGLVSL